MRERHWLLLMEYFYRTHALLSTIESMSRQFPDYQNLKDMSCDWPSNEQVSRAKRAAEALREFEAQIRAQGRHFWVATSIVVDKHAYGRGELFVKPGPCPCCGRD